MKKSDLRLLIRECITEVKNEDNQVLEEGRLTNWAAAAILTLSSIPSLFSQTTATKVAPKDIIQRATELSDEIKTNPDKFRETLKNFNLTVSDANLEQLKDVKEKDLRAFTTDNAALAQKAIERGGAIAKVTTKTDTIKGKKEDIKPTKTTIKLQFKGDKFFPTGKFELDENIKDTISKFVKSIEGTNGTITKATITASTDQEEIPSLANKNDPTGNISLANKRIESMNEFVKSQISGVSTVSNPLPNQGTTTTADFKEVATDKAKTKSLREKESKNRYVDVTFEVDMTVPSPSDSKKTDRIIVKNLYQIVQGAQETVRAKGGTDIKSVGGRGCSLNIKGVECSFDK